jgi:hypothetical protein
MKGLIPIALECKLTSPASAMKTRERERENFSTCSSVHQHDLIICKTLKVK